MAFPSSPFPCAANNTHVSSCKVVSSVQGKVDHIWDLFCTRSAPEFITQVHDGTRRPALCHAITMFCDSSAGHATTATPGFPLHLERDVLQLAPEQPKMPHWLHLSKATQQSPFAHPVREQHCPVMSMLLILFSSNEGQLQPSWLPAMVPGLCHCQHLANVSFGRVLLSMGQTYAKKHANNNYTVWTSMAQCSSPSDTGVEVAIQPLVCSRVWMEPSPKLHEALKRSLCFLCRYCFGNACVPGPVYTQRSAASAYWG